MDPIMFTLGAHIVYAIIWASVFKRAGFRRYVGLGLMMLIPFVNLAVLVWFICRSWPIEQEALTLRAVLNKGNETDTTTLLALAGELDQQGEWHRAIGLYEIAAMSARGKPEEEYIRNCIRSVCEKIARLPNA